MSHTVNPRLNGVYHMTRLTGGGYLEPPSYLRNYWLDFKIKTTFDSPAKTVERKLILLTLKVTDDVTGQVKVKIIDIWSMFTLWALTVAKPFKS